jgi:DNA-directed RNA polymerase specialized sigma24 family protein
MTDAVQALPPSNEPTPESFEDLWTPTAYRRLRGRLVRIFARRGCTCPEELADETISRVLARQPEISRTYVGDPIRFVHGVARNVFLEYSRRPRAVSLEEGVELSGLRVDEGDSRDNQALECLERCLSKLSGADRRLIREYYQCERHTKIDRRLSLAAEIGIPMNTLRVKAYRIRRRVSGCVQECKKGPGT